MLPVVYRSFAPSSGLWFWCHQVTFLLTEDPSYTAASRGRSKRRSKRRRRSREPPPPDRFSLYSSLSSLSGGLTVFTTNSDIQDVSTIVEDYTAVDKVRRDQTSNQVLSVFMSRQDSGHCRYVSHLMLTANFPANKHRKSF